MSCKIQPFQQHSGIFVLIFCSNLDTRVHIQLSIIILVGTTFQTHLLDVGISLIGFCDAQDGTCSPHLHMSLPGIGCGRGKTARPGWEVAVTPDRMQLECIRAMVGSKRAGGSDRMEQRASRLRHKGVGSWWRFSFWQKVVYNSCILRLLQKSLITLHNYPLLNLAE